MGLGLTGDERASMRLVVQGGAVHASGFSNWLSGPLTVWVSSYPLHVDDKAKRAKQL